MPNDAVKCFVKSHPTRVRGLKLCLDKGNQYFLVAPHTGAWIETAQGGTDDPTNLVAPHTGAWIETSNNILVIASVSSHPTRVRGLKPDPNPKIFRQSCRTPHGCVD